MHSGRWVVHKFGGSSVGSEASIRRVADLVARPKGARQAVVVSAVGGVTDSLYATLRAATQRSDALPGHIDALDEKHVQLAQALIPGAAADDFVENFRSDLEDLRDILRGCWLSRSASLQIEELVSGYGELWSSALITAFFKNQGLSVTRLDARDVFFVKPDRSGRPALCDPSKAQVTQFFSEISSDIVVMTGYLASTPEGIPTTLQRNGSDLSASLLGAMLNAQSITIWTDVDGVLSADPRRVPDAALVPSLSYHEATELAYFGAKVVHPQAIEPAVQSKIPVYVKNTFRPECPGTRIADERSETRDLFGDMSPVKGFSSIDDVALINLEGSGLIGNAGTSGRVFSALRSAGVSVIMISQASSEYSISVAVPAADAAAAEEALKEALAPELAMGTLRRIEVEPKHSIVAAVGDDMAATPGVSAKFLGALGHAGINVYAIAQGASERNVSVVVRSDQTDRALRAAHAQFHLTPRTLLLGVVGPGLVGQALLRQLQEQTPALKEKTQIDLKVIGIANSKKMHRAAGGSELSALDEQGEAVDLSAFGHWLTTQDWPHACIVDCTASDRVADHYVEWLRGGLHIVTPNKMAGAGDIERYFAIQQAAKETGTEWFGEATVGAGLPILATLRDLLQTGDQVRGIEGVFSGTMSFLFNAFDGTRPFSDIVRDAKARGFTEPDPRQDLSGMDVGRKAVILARATGHEARLDATEIESLIPEALRGDDVSADEFLEKLPAMDDALEQRRAAADKRGMVLRYVGSVQPDGSCQAKLGEYPHGHPFANLSGSENCFQFRTARYSDHPLIVQGPGAGAEVTAAGVFSDLLRLAIAVGG